MSQLSTAAAMETAADAIPPFNINFPNAALDDLQRRVSARKWPGRERAYPNLIHYNKLDKGEHLAAWEQPKLFTQEIRAAFPSIR